jgi:hypothetical protein
MFRKLFVVLLFGAIGVSNASNLIGLKECQSIKNSVKKAECFEKQTQKLLQEENIKKQNEEVEKARLEKIAAEEKARLERNALEEKERLEKAKLEEKLIAEKMKKIEKSQKVMQVVKRLQIRIQTGISYRDYPSVLADPKFEVQNYISENSKDLPEFSKSLEKIMNYYSSANSIWAIKFNNRSGRVSEITCSPNEASYISSLLDGAYVSRSANLTCGEGLVINDAVNMAWAKASQSIDEAGKILQTNIEEINKEKIK